MAVAATVVLILVVAVGRLGEGPQGFFDFFVILTFLPASVLVVGIGAGLAVRVPRAWAVALVAPSASLGALELLPRRPSLQVAITVTIYAALGALSAALSRR